MLFFRYSLLMSLLLFFTCSENNKGKVPINKNLPLFTIVPSETSNINFSNELIESTVMNGLIYEYFYNGGGVSVGDLNGVKRGKKSSAYTTVT